MSMKDLTWMHFIELRRLSNTKPGWAIAAGFVGEPSLRRGFNLQGIGLLAIS
jgi:hypothetical protein